MQPNRLNLANGSYILWDREDGYFRVAYYLVKRGKSRDLELAVAEAMKKKAYDPTVAEIVRFMEESANATAST